MLMTLAATAAKHFQHKDNGTSALMAVRSKGHRFESHQRNSACHPSVVG